MASAENHKLASVVILAAGEGTRMRSTKPKVLHEIAGRPLLHHVLNAVSELPSEKITVVVGSGKEQVEDFISSLKNTFTNLETVFQAERRGTGDAVSIAMESLSNEGNILILAGDTPLMTKETLLDFYRDHMESERILSLLTVEASDPFGYGRVIRDERDQLLGVREERDASEFERAINEINTGVYLVNSIFLSQALGNLRPQNAQGEYYLTDIISIIRSIGGSVGAYCAHDEEEFLGINDRVQLSEVAEIYQERRNIELMENGVTMIDPTTTWVDADVIIDRDVEIWPGSFILGTSKIESGAVIGPRTVIRDSHIESGANIRESEVTSSQVGKNAVVGPYSYLRAGTKLAANGKIGAFVETKNAEIGEGSKVPHLSYVGDATIGVGTNIGAATVFVNYDGENKHHTTVGDHVRVGSDSMLVAPITIGDGAYTAAGSVITEDVPAGSIAVARERQRNILGWVLRKRPGSKSAEAAKAAGAN